MDILFIIPDIESYEEKVKLDNLLSSSVEMMPLGVFYLASVLSKNGYSVDVIDFNTLKHNSEINEYINDIASKKPKLIGFSTSTTSYPSAKKMSKILKKELGNDCLFVWGGYHVTFMPDEPLQEGLADIVVRGEGEHAILDIARLHLESDGRLELIKGISYKLNGNIVNNQPAILRISNLDSIPIPKRDLINFNKYRNPGTIISSRGCVANCQFCAAGSLGGIAMRGVENVLSEIRLLYNDYGFRHLFFVDNTFTSHKKRAISILERTKAESMKVHFSIESRASQVDEDYIRRLADNSLNAIQFGVESGNGRILEEIGKKITLKQVENVVDLCLKYGIKVMTSFIIGHPGDTKETVWDTINFAKKLIRRGAHAVFGIMTPFPGTDVFINRNKLGVEIVEWDFSKWNLNIPVIRTKNLSQRDLKILLAEATSEINAVY